MISWQVLCAFCVEVGWQIKCKIKCQGLQPASPLVGLAIWVLATCQEKLFLLEHLCSRCWSLYIIYIYILTGAGNLPLYFLVRLGWQIDVFCLRRGFSRCFCFRLGGMSECQILHVGQPGRCSAMCIFRRGCQIKRIRRS